MTRGAFRQERVGPADLLGGTGQANLGSGEAVAGHNRHRRHGTHEATAGKRRAASPAKAGLNGQLVPLQVGFALAQQRAGIEPRPGVGDQPGSGWGLGAGLSAALAAMAPVSSATAEPNRRLRPCGDWARADCQDGEAGEDAQSGGRHCSTYGEADRFPRLQCPCGSVSS